MTYGFGTTIIATKGENAMPKILNDYLWKINNWYDSQDMEAGVAWALAIFLLVPLFFLFFVSVSLALFYILVIFAIRVPRHLGLLSPPA